MTARDHHHAGPHRGRPTYMHELEEWPNFRWDEEPVTQPLEMAQARLLENVANTASMDQVTAAEATVRHLTASAVATSHIENEYPDPRAVEAEIRRRITGESPRTDQVDHDAPGIAVVTADTATNYVVPLTAERLHEWHRQLFSAPHRHDITVGRWRDDQLGRMRVVSRSPMDQTIVHFEAPATDRLDDEMERFLEWFNRPEVKDDLLHAAIAHLWFVTIHPYDDGNGRIARAITDLALARCDGTDRRSYSMSAEILQQRESYYQALQVTQSGSMNITNWLAWFLNCLSLAIDAS